MRFLFLLLLATTPLSGLAQMYKCVDERGVTTYSDKPRPRCKGGEVDIRASPPLSGQVQPRSADLAEEGAAFRRRQNQCKSLRQEQARLSSGRRLSQVNADGEHVYLPDNVRSQRLDQVSAALRACP